MPAFDLFLSHNSADKPAVREIARALKERRYKPWLDADELTPGLSWQDLAEEAIETCRAAAVFVGPNGIGPWEHEELKTCLTQAVKRKIPVIPVLLPGAPKKPDLPLFLGERTWVDLRTTGITPAGLDLLVWGITGKKPRSRSRVQSSSPPGPPPLHNLPLYLRSLGDLFQGRGDELRRLADSLQGNGEPRALVQDPQALYGLGGIGKTRLAAEYAWRFGARYTAAFFLRAETPEVLQTGLASLAGMLDLPEKQAQSETIQSVLRWLRTNPGWLLILDNVDSREAERAVMETLPALTGGQILITSRLRNWPRSIQKQDLGTIPLEEARIFLLKRTDGERRTTDEDAVQAGLLAEELGGLPLALEQAGAYIAHTRLSFRAYRKVWAEEKARALDWHDESMGYPVSVAATWRTSFDRLHATAGTLLRLMAFLAPEPIPEAMFEAKKELVGEAARGFREETGQEDDADAIDEALAELESFSLLARGGSGTCTVHRVVQEVVQGRIPPERRKGWIETTLKIVNGHAPFAANDVRTWPVWNALRPHATRIVSLADETGAAGPVGRLMNQLAVYLNTRGLYREAEPLMRRALAIDEASFGNEHPDVAIDLNHLAQLLQDTNRLSEAEPLMRRALAIDEASFGQEHPNVAIRLNNLAALLQATNRLSEAEPLMRRALAIDEASFGKEHPKVAIRLNNLAQLLKATNRLSEAEPLMRRALALDEASFGNEHPKVAIRLNNLAQLLKATNRLSEAEPLMRQTLAIDEASFGNEHPDVAIDLSNLAQLLKATNRLSEAEPLMRRAVAIFERSLGADHPNTRTVQENLAFLLAKIEGAAGK